MKILHSFRLIHDKVVKQLLCTLHRRSEWGNIKRKHHLIEKVTLTNEQKKKIDTFYIQHYGKKIPYQWHRLYQSYLGVYTEYYLPEIIYSTELEPILCPRAAAETLQDKNLCDLVCSGVTCVRCPTRFGSCVNGSYQNAQKTFVTKDELVYSLRNIGNCVVKKSTDTSSGRDVMMCNFCNGNDISSQKSINDILREMGDNFIVQEKIEQWHELAALYPKSLNTFRVMTYLCDDDVHLCPLALRMGRNGADRDNIHYGGIVIGVSLAGCLKDKAFSEFQEIYEQHPDSGTVFPGYQIQHVDRIINAAKQMHRNIPQLKVISWDLSLDSSGQPVLIEINISGQSSWFPQMVNGEPLFGVHTGRMLELVKHT